MAGGSSETAPTDEELLVRVAARDPSALADLYDRHADLAYGIALRVTASVPAAEDAVQEAFLAIWRAPGSFDPARGSARSWLTAIVHHRAIDLVRRRRSSTSLPDAEVAQPPELILPDVWPEVAGRIDATAIRAALATLPQPQREAIGLAYWGGLTQSEIAARTNTPLGTVKGRMRLGLLALGRALGGGPPGTPDQAATLANETSREATVADSLISRLTSLIRRLRGQVRGLRGVLEPGWSVAR